LLHSSSCRFPFLRASWNRAGSLLWVGSTASRSVSMKDTISSFCSGRAKLCSSWRCWLVWFLLCWCYCGRRDCCCRYGSLASKDACLRYMCSFDVFSFPPRSLKHLWQ
jgi:hypothetical protein